ncbi:MAG: hypothetical protein ACREDO_13735 [Methyloceanibacter sp.]
MFSRSASRLLALLPLLWLGGCADNLPAGRPIAELVRGYSHTLTKDEKKRVITELQKDKERQLEQSDQPPAETKTD